MNPQPCPLCKTAKAEPFFEDNRRSYFRCRVCQLTFVPTSQYLSTAAEKAEYDLHQNSSDDPDYRQFLSRIFNPMQAQLASKSHGLDFGSGPGPTLSVMFEEAGHSVVVYDYFYAKNPSVFDHQYDFITATEVVEHLHQPLQELDRLWACLKPGGLLGIMTKLALNRDAFSRWHYKNDLTHVCFFSKQTFQWLAHKWQADITFAAKDVTLFLKQD